MASVIKIKRSTTPGSAPSTLAAGEIAVNIPDRLLFVGDGSSIYRIGAQYLSVANAATIYQTKTVERAALANTNAFIATKLNTSTFNSALANTNSSIATQASRITLVNTNLLATNTAIRALDNQKLSVANAAATYQTRAIERAALANTNASIATQTARITLVNTNLTATNTAIRALDNQKLSVANATTLLAAKASWAGLTATNAAIRTLVSDRLQVANASTLYTTKTNPTTSGVFAHTGRMTISTNLAVSGNTRITGSTIIDGDLTVEGGVTYISSSTLNVDDSLIKLSSNNAADTVDSGFYNKYVAAATPKFAGIFRDASDGIFKVFAESQAEPTTTVNVAATGYTLAQLDAVIDGGTY
jgi:hypothetical protein